MLDVLSFLQQIDCDVFIKAAALLIALNGSDYVINWCSFNKDFNSSINLDSVLIPPELIAKYSTVNLEKLKKSDFANTLINFAKLMKKTFKREDLTLFYNNINELTVRKDIFALLLLKILNASGSYNGVKNRIAINLKIDKKAIYHELFHMASGKVEGDVLYSGFSQKLNNKWICEGLNEGYTELLCARYFTNQPTSYEYEVKQVKLLEQIVGQEKMEKLYLTANLKGLINELRIYADDDEITEFISAFEFLHKHLDGNNFSHKNRLIEISLKRVNIFLLNAYITKLKIMLSNGLICDSLRLKKLYNNFTKRLIYSVKTDKHTFEILTSEDIEEIYKANFETSFTLKRKTP